MRLRLFLIGVVLGAILFLVGGVVSVPAHTSDQPTVCLTRSAQIEMHYPQFQCH